MGLLTDPSAGQGKLTKALLKYHSKLCVLLYLGGIVWFLLQAYPTMIPSTYFSENALLPGLVENKFYDEKSANRYYEELLDEMKKYDNSIPSTWLLAKFRQIGLDSYTHNFTLHSPLSKKEIYTGTNVYGILRAARASSTEAVVLSAPYRSSVSAHPPTAASIALMLAFAKYANKEKYWAKDIIFLVTEHDQLGIQAWLEAYHGTTCGNEGTLIHGDLKGRAGAIQAAINLELHDIKIGQIEIKIEGLNGQLPNLDLFNLAAKMCIKEGVHQTFKGKLNAQSRDPNKIWVQYLKTLMAMMSTLATGIPNGNHGLFHRFGIQALTLEGFHHTILNTNRRVTFLSIGRIIEGIFRSLNNLLERFHQSFFFYLLPSSDRYISIGLYMPSICLIAASLVIKACAIWCRLQEKKEDSNDGKHVKNEQQKPINFESIIFYFLFVHSFGIILLNAPQFLLKSFENYNFNTKICVVHGIYTMCGLMMLVPFFIGFKKCERSMSTLNVFSLLELGTALVCISMNNFSLGFFCGIICVPLALFINPTTCRYYSFLQKFFWLMIHPVLVLVIIVLINTYILFPDERFKEIFFRGLDATNQAIIYSIVDSIIYGNWLFSVVTCIFIPNWLCFWSIAFTTVEKQNNKIINVAKKKD